MKSVAEVLNEAAEYIEEHGHWKRVYFGPAGEACAMGAIVRGIDPAARRPQDFPSAEYRLWDSAVEAVEGAVGVMLIDLWNDDPRRTKDEVVAALRAAAARAGGAS